MTAEVEQMCGPCVSKRIDGSCKLDHISTLDQEGRANRGRCEEAARKFGTSSVPDYRDLINGQWVWLSQVQSN